MILYDCFPPHQLLSIVRRLSVQNDKRRIIDKLDFYGSSRITEIKPTILCMCVCVPISQGPQPSFILIILCSTLARLEGGGEWG